MQSAWSPLRILAQLAATALSTHLDVAFASAENADLAAGYARVLVLSSFGGRSMTPLSWGMHLATQVDEPRARGSSVETIFPDSDSEHMLGAAAMGPPLRPLAGQAGYDQGKPSPRSSQDPGADALESPVRKQTHERDVDGRAC